MKPRVLALDFDGTITVNDTIHADVAAAVQEARAAGLLVVLVTGRILSEVEARFRGPLPFDVIVAENGAILKVPDYGRRSRWPRRLIGGFLPSCDAMRSGIARGSVSSKPRPTMRRRSSRLFVVCGSRSASRSISDGSWCCHTA
jgi:hypothetical protein